MQRKLLRKAVGLAVGACLMAPQAWASEGTCTPAQARSEAAALVEKIATAPSVEDARALATQPTRGAHFALTQARRIAPWTASLRTADEKLTGYEARVAAAASPAAVAQEFAALVQVGRIHADLEVGGGEADVNVAGGGCSYSTGEIIATVLGFILGIIPGIILLFLLC